MERGDIPDFDRISSSVQSGGYEHEFVDRVPEKYICSTICTKVLRDPHLTACCGQHFCESCLQKYIRTQGRERCPHCRAQGRQFIHIPNKPHKREINELKIYCTNRKEGCDWVGELGTLETHLESDRGCGYHEVDCTNFCGEQLKRKELANHLAQHCPQRYYICEHCGKEDIFKTITEEHYDECPNYPLDCPNECGAKQIKRVEMDQHRSNCPLEPVECSNKCQIPLKRKDLEDHLAQHCPKRHYICEHCGEEDTYQTITEKHYDECPNYPLDCPNECGARGIKRVEMEEHQSQCPLETVECPFQDAGCQAKLVRKDFDSHMTVNQQQHLLTLMGAFREAKTELAATKDDLYKTRNELEAMKTRQEVTATDVVIMHQRDQKELADLALASIKTQLESKSFRLQRFGQPFTFRMTSFSHYQRTGKVWYSPPFYYDNGYKMQLAVYANGTGAGAGTHVSVTLLLMKGEFDHQIDWPIQSEYVISIEIIAQKNIEAQYIREQKSLKEKSTGTVKNTAAVRSTSVHTPHPTKSAEVYAHPWPTELTSVCTSRTMKSAEPTSVCTPHSMKSTGDAPSVYTSRTMKSTMKSTELTSVCTPHSMKSAEPPSGYTSRTMKSSVPTSVCTPHSMKSTGDAPSGYTSRTMKSTMKSTESTSVCTPHSMKSAEPPSNYTSRTMQSSEPPSSYTSRTMKSSIPTSVCTPHSMKSAKPTSGYTSRTMQSAEAVEPTPVASITICSTCTPAIRDAIDEGVRALGSEERFCDHGTTDDELLLNDSLLLRTTVKQHYCEIALKECYPAESEVIADQERMTPVNVIADQERMTPVNVIADQEGMTPVNVIADQEHMYMTPS